jgi:hypothetical protein
MANRLFSLDKGVLVKIIEKIEERHLVEIERLEKKIEFLSNGIGGELSSYFCEWEDTDPLTFKKVKCQCMTFYNPRLGKYCNFGDISGFYYCFKCYKEYCSKHLSSSNKTPCCGEEYIPSPKLVNKN